MRNSILWLAWLVLPVFVLAFHYGPGQIWLVRDQAASLIRQAQVDSDVATEAQEAAHQSQLKLLAARREAFLAGVDWQTQTTHPLAKSVIEATQTQDAAYEHAAQLWHQTAGKYGEATEALLKVISSLQKQETDIPTTDRNLLESLRWAEARALVRSGEVFNGIEQLQALLDLRTAEENQRAALFTRLASTSDFNQPDGADDTSSILPIDAIREELAAAQYIGARLLREEGRPSEVWRPVSNAARQHYRYLASAENNDGEAIQTTVRSENASSGATDDNLDRGQRMQRNLEQVLNLEQTPSDQLEGIPLPRRAPLSRRPGDGEPGDKPGGAPRRGPLRDGPPGAGAGVPQPWGVGW
ncbi:MAG: hypothetical protein Aurels2KO_06380 [Aureliella sp.]